MTLYYFDKEIIAEYSTTLDGEYFSVYVCHSKQKDYWDIHVISEKYKNDETNTLKLQEPKECVNKEYFTEARLICYLMDHFIWDRFYSELQENDISAFVDYEKH
jgi:hypothetical protein